MELTSATGIADLVRSGRLSAVEVAAQSIEAAIESHEDLNAFTLIDRSGAMSRAEGIDRLVAAGKDPGPLAGVPVALKDLIDQAGLPNTRGSSFPASLSENSATVVRRLGAAGAVIVGRTGLHEFAFGFTSENPWFGPVRNPWDTGTSPGGSSGGSGAAVAAGITPVSIGTDTGGSVRVPAALCGIFGLKVTHGRIPLTGVFPLAASLDTVGPLAKTVDDISAVYLATAGSDRLDPWSAVRQVESPSAWHGDAITLGVVKQWMDLGPLSRDTRSSIDGFIAGCVAAGITVEVVDDPQLEPPSRLSHAVGPEILAVHGARFGDHRDRYGKDLIERLDLCSDGSALDVLDAHQWAAAARNGVERLSRDGIDLLVAPTVGHNRKTIGDDMMHADGASHRHRQYLASFTAPINRAGLPSLAAPIATGDGLPYSVQLIGPMWQEHRILAIARRLEAAGLLGTGRPSHWYGSNGNGSDASSTQ